MFNFGSGIFKKEKKQDKITIINNVERVWMFKLFGQINVAERLQTNEIVLHSYSPNYYYSKSLWYTVYLDVTDRMSNYIKVVSEEINRIDRVIQIEVHLSSIDDFEMC